MSDLTQKQTLTQDEIYLISQGNFTISKTDPLTHTVAVNGHEFPLVNLIVAIALSQTAVAAANEIEHKSVLNLQVLLKKYEAVIMTGRKN